MAIYFPVLRWKQGERAALANLAPEVKDKIAPIIEFPRGCGYTDRKHTNFCRNAVNDWGIARPFYLDLSAINYYGAPNDVNHPAWILLKTAHQQGLVPIPILYINMDPHLFSIIKQAYASSYFENVALRINENEEDTANFDAMEMISNLEISQANVDLIFDLRDISNGHVPAKIRILRDLVAQFGNEYCRKIALCGAIPSQLGVKTDDNECIPRHDWQLWCWVQHNPKLSQLLFGDYTTVPAEFVEIPYPGAPKIKYTLDNEWFVIKGHRPRRRENQRQNQAATIVNAPFFRGAEHSFGELRIHQCAEEEWGPGNSTSWVTNDINQHITFVVSQVSAILHAP